jgi:predicted NUDIX family phosphoesterase
MKEILVIPKSAIPIIDGRLHNLTTKMLLHIINTKSFFMPRPEAEINEDYLQIIPYIIVKKDDQIFTYTRLGKGNETRLHNLMSVGIGGHIDKIDSYIANKYNSNIIEDSAYRELFEELDIELTSHFLPLDTTDVLIYDSSNAVGRVHLGIVYSVDVSNREVKVKEVDKIEGKFINLTDLKELYTKNNNLFETWSEIALRELGLI